MTGGSWRERHGIASVVKLFFNSFFYYCEGASLTNGAPSYSYSEDRYDLHTL